MDKIKWSMISVQILHTLMANFLEYDSLFIYTQRQAGQTCWYHGWYQECDLKP